MTKDEKQKLIEQVTNEFNAKHLFDAFFYTTDGLIQRGKELGIEIPYTRILGAIKRQPKTSPRDPALDTIRIGKKGLRAFWLITKKSGDIWAEHQTKKFVKKVK